MNDLLEVTTEVQKVFGDIPVFAVGGCMRDHFLKRVPKDYDFATPALPEDIEAKIKEAGRRAYMTGARYGTIGFKANVANSWQYVEVTTFRKEEYEPGSRKPRVEFIPNLKEDLARRDLTINAIAMGADGTVHDPFGGRLDILEKKIKAVGDAKDRFREDPLRMLRAARFAAQLGFDVDPNMIGKTRRVAKTIMNVSRERWVQEIDKLLCGESFELGLLALEQMHLLRYVLPEVDLLSVTRRPLFLDTIKRIEAAPKDADDRWAALLMSLGSLFIEQDERTLGYKDHNLIGVEIARGIASRLKFSNYRVSIIESAVLKQKL